MTEIREYCERRSWELRKIFTDTGWSGTKRNRPALIELMNSCRLRVFDCVLVSKLDRFGRSAIDLAQNILALKSQGVRFIAISQGIDTDDSHPGSTLLMNILGAIAQFESEIIRERTLSGLHHARKFGTKSGKPIGRPKKVFRRDEAVELRGQGVSYREIARRLNVGVGTVLRACAVPKPWTPPDENENDNGQVSGSPDASL